MNTIGWKIYLRETIIVIKFWKLNKKVLFKRIQGLSSSKILTKVRIWQKTLTVNPQAPVAQKFVDEVVFRGFQGEGVEFF